MEELTGGAPMAGVSWLLIWASRQGLQLGMVAKERPGTGTTGGVVALAEDFLSNPSLALRVLDPWPAPVPSMPTG